MVLLALSRSKSKQPFRTQRSGVIESPEHQDSAASERNSELIELHPYCGSKHT